MDKYSVVLDDEKTKTSSTTQVCPKCGRKLITHPPATTVEIPYCDNCGTEPFEKQPEQK